MCSIAGHDTHVLEVTDVTCYHAVVELLDATRKHGDAIVQVLGAKNQSPVKRAAECKSLEEKFSRWVQSKLANTSSVHSMCCGIWLNRLVCYLSNPNLKVSAVQRQMNVQITVKAVCELHSSHNRCYGMLTSIMHYLCEMHNELADQSVCDAASHLALQGFRWKHTDTEQCTPSVQEAESNLCMQMARFQLLRRKNVAWWLSCYEEYATCLYYAVRKTLHLCTTPATKKIAVKYLEMCSMTRHAFRFLRRRLDCACANANGIAQLVRGYAVIIQKIVGTVSGIMESTDVTVELLFDLHYMAPSATPMHVATDYFTVHDVQ